MSNRKSSIQLLNLNLDPSRGSVQDNYTKVDQSTFSKAVKNLSISHSRSRSEANICLEATLRGDPQNFSILKEIQGLKSNPSTSLEKERINLKKQRLLDIFAKNENKKVTEDERGILYKFLSSKEINAMVEFRTLDLKKVHYEMVSKYPSQKIEKNKEIRRVYHEIQENQGDVMSIKDISALNLTQQALKSNVSKITNELGANYYDITTHDGMGSDLINIKNSTKLIFAKKKKKRIRRKGPTGERSQLSKCILKFLNKLQTLKLTIKEVSIFLSKGNLIGLNSEDF